MTAALSESLEKAIQIHQSGDLGSAEKIYRKILRVDPANGEVLHLLGIVQHQQGRNVAALDYIGQAIDISETTATYWNSLGTVHRSLGQPQKALAAFQRAIQIAPRFADAYNNLGLILAELSEHKGAEACYRQALEINPDEVNAHYNLAATLLNMDDAAEALEHIHYVICFSAESAPRCCNLAHQLELLGRFDEALAIYQLVADRLPESSAASFGVAHVLLSQRNHEESKRWYQKGLILDPKNAPAWTNLGCIQSELGDLSAAIESFQNAIEVDGRFAAAHYNLANTLAAQREFGRSIESFRRTLELEPFHAAALKNLGNSLVAAGDYSEAESCYRELLSRQPDDVGAHLNLAQVLKQQRKFSEAEAEYRLVLRNQPDNSAVHFVLGRTLELSGRIAEALPSYRRAAELEPGDAKHHFHLGNALKAQGSFHEAIASYTRSRELNPDHLPTLYQLGNTYRNLKRFDEARECYEEVLRHNPDDFETMISLGNVLKSQDDLAGAAAQYRTVLKQLPDQPLWQLWTATLCPVVFHSTVGIDDYRARLAADLKRLARKNLQITPEDITQCGCPPPYVLQFHGRNDRPLKEAYARVFRNCLQPEPITKRDGKPRIGFVVTEGHEGVFLRYLGKIVEQLSPAQFDVSIICSAGGQERIKRDFHSETVELLVVPSRFDRIVEVVREARFDLLYHWEVGSDVTNYFLPLFRLAPVQCTGAGVPVTSGFSQIDYFLSDGLAEPEGAHRHYTETLVRGNSLMTCQRRLELPNQPKSRDDFGVTRNQHLYVCPNKIEKFHPDMDQLFRDILRRDPHGVIVIPKDREGYVARKLQNRFALTAPDVFERIVFIPYQTLDGYLSLIAAADVLLDPLHYGGGLTTLDGLSLNQPIVTLPGEFLRGRFTYGFYRRMNILECVAGSVESYVETAVRIATDVEYREYLRGQLLEHTPVLFDDSRSIDEYQQLFQSWIDDARGHEEGRRAAG